MNISRPEVAFVVQIRFVKVIVASFCAVLFAFAASADDFGTIDGKEYKNVTVSRVEPDGIVLVTSSGISKVSFTELSKEVQERFHYDATKAAAYSTERTANQEALYKQRRESERHRVEERARYWREHPTPEPHRESNAIGSSLDRRASSLTGSALDRPAYGQATTAAFLFSQYATNQINADKQYNGRIFTVSGTIKSVTPSGEEIAVELVVPYYAPEVYYIRCNFNNSRGLEQFQAGNPISLTGTVDGVCSYKTLTIKDCHLR